MELRDALEYFLSGDLQTTVVDRHVRGVSKARPSDEDIRSTCHEAITAMREWSELLSRADYPIGYSEPVAIIDDDWLAGAENATPPHVFVVLSREGETPAVPDWKRERRERSGIEAIDRLMSSDLEISRAEPGDEDDDRAGAWFVSRRAGVV
jgi:hypothetical protein